MWRREVPGEGKTAGRKGKRDRDRESGYGRLLVDNARFLLPCLSSRFPGLLLRASHSILSPSSLPSISLVPTFCQLTAHLPKYSLLKAQNSPNPFFWGKKLPPAFASLSSHLPSACSTRAQRTFSIKRHLPSASPSPRHGPTLHHPCP